MSDHPAQTTSGESALPLGIDLSQVFRLAEATRYFPGRAGRRVSLQTLHRWATRGVRGVRLRTVRLGGQHTCTCEAWVHEFVAALNGSRVDTLRGIRPTGQEAARRDRVEAELDRAGL